jgi:branched-chain amino acid transport system substrate-binding protein
MRCLGLAAAAVVLLAGTAQAEIANGKVKIGVLTDMSGVYEAGAGPGAVEMAKMAAEEFGNKINGVPIEIVAADHQNKPDVGAAIAARWFDLEGVNAVTDLVNSAVAFAVLEVAKQKDKTVLLTSAGSADFTGKACAPDNSVHWVYDTYELGFGIGKAVPRLGKTWFFLTADYSFGYAMEKGVSAALAANGATVVGSVHHPLSASDFSSFILQAQASKAEVIAINNGGEDAANAIKTAREFGLTAKLVGFGVDLPSTIKAMTLQTAQGVMYVTPWVQKDDAETKAFIAKFQARRGVPPGSFQAGTYSAVRSYLKAVEATNSTDSKTVIAKMREMPVNDVFAHGGHLRADGRMVHDVALMQIKTPAESKSEWDLVKTIAVIPGDEVFRPMSQGGCPFVK